MKKIEDYLHLYLGCECIMTRNSYHAVHQLRLSSETPFNLTGQLCDYFSDSTTKAECKPILRKLDSMTEEELKEVYDIGSSKWAGGVQQMCMMQAWNPNQFILLLSKGIDLFGLIDAGLALDAMKTESTSE